MLKKMRKKIKPLLFIFISLLFNCQEEKEQNIVKIKPLEELKQVDKLLSKVESKPQSLITTSERKTIVTGDKGTIIHVNPVNLETVDGSQISEKIEIELLELTTTSNLVLNNAQTLSNEKLLVSGGAYYINITSQGKQLKLKKGKSLEVEFPKLTENEMGLFLGERDSLGQINWIATKDNFQTKNIIEPQEPKKPAENSQTESIIQATGIDDILAYSESDSLTAPEVVQKDKVSEKEYQEYLKKKEEYEKAKKQIEYERKTYEKVKLLNFGWINVDRFYEDTNPKIDIQLLVKNDSIRGARIFTIFEDINSIMTEQYWKGRKDTIVFKEVPIGMKLSIVALSVNENIPLIFKKNITSEKNELIEINFETTTQDEIKEFFENLN